MHVKIALVCARPKMESNCVALPIRFSVLQILVMIGCGSSSPMLLDFSCLLCSFDCRMKSVLSEEDEDSAAQKSQEKQEKEQDNARHQPNVDPEQSLFSTGITMVKST